MNILRQPVGREVKETLDILMNSSHWDSGRLQELQWQKLEKLIRHAYNTCPFYRRRFDEAKLHPTRDFKHFDSLAKLPVLTKADIQLHLAELKTTDPTVKGIELNSTGGSTGVPINFFQDCNYRIWADAMRIRSWKRHPGISNNAIEAVLWGAERDVGKGLRLIPTMRNLVRRRTLCLNTFDLDPDTIRKFFRIFNVVRPQILRGYASSLYFIGNFISDNAIEIYLPKIIISSAEVLRPPMRETISRVFGTDVIDSYGCREVSHIGMECDAHSGFHIAMENQLLELDDGNIIITNLNNLGMPFIRYEVGDRAESIEKSPCKCGRHSYRLTRLMGRNNDNIELPNGKVINGEFFEFLFFGLKTVEQFQVVYSRAQEQLRIRLQVSSRSEAVDSVVVDRMAKVFAFTNVKVEFTTYFDRTPTGKFRFVYSVDDFGDCTDGIAR